MSDATVDSAFGGRHGGLGATLFRAVARAFEKRAVRNAIRELNALDDRQLDDIGLNRADLYEWAETGVRPRSTLR